MPTLDPSQMSSAMGPLAGQPDTDSSASANPAGTATQQVPSTADLATQGGAQTSGDIMQGGAPLNTRTAPPAPPVAPPQHRSLMADILHAIGEVLGGPSTTRQVNPQTGQIEDVPLSRAGRIANTASIYLRGAAAGAAQHGPAAIGKAALAGVQEQQGVQQQETQNLQDQSKLVSQQLMNRFQIANANNQSLLAWRRYGLESEEEQARIDDADRAFDLQMQQAGAVPVPMLVNGKDVNGGSDENSIMQWVTQNPRAPQGFDYVATRSVGADGKQTYTVYQMPHDSLNDMIDVPTADAKALGIPVQTKGATVSLRMRDLMGFRGQYLKQLNDQATLAKTVADTQEAQAGAKLKTAQTTEAYTNAHKAVAEMGVQGADKMIDTGVNPYTHEQLNLLNAPDTMMVDQQGRPIPFKMLTAMKPSQQETNRADFANSVVHMLDSVDKLKAAGKLPNGPVTGLTKSMLAKAGLGDADAQKAINDISLIQSAATGAHVGGRFSVPVLQKMQGLLGMNMNDAQFQGAEDSIRDVMQGYVQSGGRHTVAQWKQDHAVYMGGQLVGYANADGSGMVPVKQGQQ